MSWKRHTRSNKQVIIYFSVNKIKPSSHEPYHVQNVQEFFFFWGGGRGGDGQGYYGGLKRTRDFWTKAELKGDREGGIWAHKGEREGTLLPRTLIPFPFQCLPCRLKQIRPLENVHQGSQASANKHLLPVDTLSWSQEKITDSHFWIFLGI